MKKLLTSLAAFTALTAAASAADLPRRVAPPPVFTPVPVFTWTGFYAGFNAGYGFATEDNNRATIVGVGPGTGLVVAPTVIAFPGQRSSDGFVGGGQIATTTSSPRLRHRRRSRGGRPVRRFRP